MPLPLSACLNPSGQFGDLFLGQRLAKIRRWHLFIFDRGGDMMKKQAFLQVTRFRDRRQSLFGVTSQIRFPLVGIRAMTCIAVVGEQWPNIPIKSCRLLSKTWRRRIMHQSNHAPQTKLPVSQHLLNSI